MKLLHQVDSYYSVELAAERVLDPDHPGRAVFAVERAGKIHYEPQLALTDGTLTPLPASAYGLSLPVGAVECGEIRQLAEEVREYLRSVTPLTAGGLGALAGYVLASWVAESRDFLPIVAILGPQGSGRTTILRAIEPLLRRPLLLDGAERDFYDLAAVFTPSLLLDLPAPPHGRLLQMLRQSTDAGIKTLRRGQLVATMGARVVAFPGLLPADLADRALSVTALDQALWIPPPAPAPTVMQLLPRLAGFRLRYFGRLGPAGQNGATALDRLWATLEPFLPAEIEEIHAYLVAQSSSADPLAPEARELLKLLVAWAHRSKSEIALKAIAAELGAVVASYGDDPKSVTSKSIGIELRAWQLEPRRIAAGMVLRWNSLVASRIHALMAIFGQDGWDGCADCQRVGLEFNDVGDVGDVGDSLARVPDHKKPPQRAKKKPTSKENAVQ